MKPKLCGVFGAIVILAAVTSLLGGCAFFDGSQGIARIDGRVRVDDSSSRSGIQVTVTYYDYAVSDTVLVGVTSTDSTGQFSITDLLIIPQQVTYRVTASKPGYATATDSYQVYYGYDGSAFSFDLELRSEKRMIIEWEYQPNRTRDLQFGTVSGQATLYSITLHGSGPTAFDFSSASLYNSIYSGDVVFYDSYNHPQSLYVYYSRCVQDMGQTPLSNITQAPEEGWECSYEWIPAVAGHVYCVRTYEGNYAKLRIVSIEPSGR